MKSNFRAALLSSMALAALLAAVPASAQDGACLTRKISPLLHVDQANGPKILVRTRQSADQLEGIAEYSAWSDGKVKTIAGPIEGSTQGDFVRFIVYWNDNTSGLYTGRIVNSNGDLIGNAVNRNDAQNKTTFKAFQASSGCLVNAPAPPPPPPPPVVIGAVIGLPAPPGWFSRTDIANTPWGFGDLNTVAWAQAARAANDLCVSKGAGAGHFNGHQDLAKGIFAGQCAKEDAVWRDASAQEISATDWSFADVNQVSWAQANRAAERLCANANQGFSGGHFNGHQVDGKYGLVCYRGASQWFDASDAELAATGWGFATPKLDDVQWSQAMRAATEFCHSKGFDGGFMNGHQAPNKYGVVCQKGAGY